MDLYRTDSSFRPLSLIDNYESCVWTDRFDSHGDFDLLVPWSPTLTRDLRNFKYLLHPESDRIMMVETVNKDKQNKNLKGNLVKVTGRSLEAFLDFRNNKTFADQESVVQTGSRPTIANYFVNVMCVTNPVSAQNLPGLVIGSPPSGTSVTLTVERGPIYSMVKQILSAENWGFKLYRTPTPGELIWQVYKGTDYTTGGLYKEFSPDDESLVDISSLESVANYVNQILAIGDKAAVTVSYDGTNTGFDLRRLVLDAQDIGPDTTTTVSEDQAALTQRAYEAKKSDEYRYVQLVDGQIPQGIHVELGDILWVQDSFGMRTLVRIAEKIWISDATGDRRLTTFDAL